MIPVSALVFAIITAIVCRGTTAHLLRRGGSEGPCDMAFTSCMKPKVNEADIKPETFPDGRVYFHAEFFTRICGYLTTISDCYGKLTLATCEPGFQNSLKENSKMLSKNVCRNADALNKLIPCLNDKEVYEAYDRAIRYEGAKKESGCNVAKEKIRRVLRVFKDRCFEDEYTSLKSVLEDFGDDLNSLFPEVEDPSCSLDIGTLTPDRRRRGMATAAIKGMMDLWIL